MIPHCYLFPLVIKINSISWSMPWSHLHIKAHFVLKSQVIKTLSRNWVKQAYPMAVTGSTWLLLSFCGCYWAFVAVTEPSCLLQGLHPFFFFNDFAWLLRDKFMWRCYRSIMCIAYGKLGCINHNTCMRLWQQIESGGMKTILSQLLKPRLALSFMILNF